MGVFWLHVGPFLPVPYAWVVGARSRSACSWFCLKESCRPWLASAWAFGRSSARLFRESPPVMYTLSRFQLQRNGLNPHRWGKSPTHFSCVAHSTRFNAAGNAVQPQESRWRFHRNPRRCWSLRAGCVGQPQRLGGYTGALLILMQARPGNGTTDKVTVASGYLWFDLLGHGVSEP